MSKSKTDCFDVELVKKEIRKLKIPKEYFNFDVEAINNHDISLYLSIRKDSAKTTQALIISLILKKLYNYECEYLRTDTDQITSSNIDNIYDVILKFDYVPKIFGEQWNTIIYKQHLKRFYLAKKDEEGNIQLEDKRPCCNIHSLEQYKRMKSSYNNVMGNLIVYDEIFDTHRTTSNQMIELCNQISTITRERPEARLLMLGNNLNRYSFWFEEFDLMHDIDNLNFGGCIDKRTELGTTIFVKLLDVSKQKKEDVLKRKVRFFGFNTPKMAAFNGLQAFAGHQWQHLEDDNFLNPEFLQTNRIYIQHRGKWVQISYYYNGKQDYVYLHYSQPPKYDDNLILCDLPRLDSDNYIYGFGADHRKEKVRKLLGRIRRLRDLNAWYYSTNNVGDLVEDYLISIR